MLFALGLLVINHLLKDQLSVAARRHFFLILILGSMFPNHLRAYTAETFTAITVIVGILAIVSGKYVGLGSAAIILGVANTPGAMIGLGLVALALCLSERKWRYFLLPVMAGALILVEAWICRGSPFTTGYENNAGFKTFMPYSGLPGFSYPLLFGLLAILFSFGKGILFFAPGMFLPPRQEQSPGKPEVRKIHLLCLLFVAGLVLLYAKWWSWYGGWFWGPRFFLFASIPASLALALRLESRNQSILGDFLTLLALALSFWVGINGAVFGQDGLEFLANHNYAFESFVWYIPEYSVLWRPLVELKALSLREYSLIALIIIVFIYLAAPPAYRLARSLFEIQAIFLRPLKPLKMKVNNITPVPNNIKHYIWVVSRMGAFPTLLYYIIFCVLTFPLILKFSTHFFADGGDGLQNVWNIWWVNKAVTELHELPWRTTYLYYPFGISLLGHTLNPFNGFMGIGLLRFLTLVETHNVIVIFSFTIGGLTAFLLSYHFTKSYWGSVIAGGIFTFSNYHFTHAEGHLQLVSLEWIPLFILLWFIFVGKPSVTVAISSALVLFAVILCDYYYFLYCVIIGFMIVLWLAIRKKDPLFLFRKGCMAPLSVFIIGVLMTSGPLVFSLLRFSAREPLLGIHPPEEVSLDLLAPFIYGAHWRFAHLTQLYWSKLTAGVNESSVHIGISVLFILLYAWKRRGDIQIEWLRFWYFAIIFFAAMGLGPVLQVWGRIVASVPMPYAFFEKVFPPLKISGCPVRMMVMVMLGASVICAAGFQSLFKQKRGKIIAGLLLMILFLEYLPRPLPATRIPAPEYIRILKDLPGADGVVDLITFPTVKLYFQTIHEKPIASGYVSRIPKSSYEMDIALLELIRTGEFEKAYFDYNIRYLLSEAVPKNIGGYSSLKPLYNDGRVGLFDMAPSTGELIKIAGPDWREMIRVNGGLMYIDTIKGQLYGQLKDKANIDPVKDKLFKIDGWAVDDNSKDSGQGVYLVFRYRGEEIIIPTKRKYRPDVAKHFKVEGYTESGWTSSVKPERFNKSCCYNLSVRILRAGGSEYYELDADKPVCFDIKP